VNLPDATYHLSMERTNKSSYHRRTTMSNSSRIEAATRSHVGATLTGKQIEEAVRLADPNWKGGVYPSDAAYKRTETGLIPRGKTAYGDGVLEYLGANSFKVLPTAEIVRRPGKAAAAPAPATPVAAATPTEEKKKEVTSAPASRIPVATKRQGAAGKEARA
jgi:hypothetical protein